MTARRTDETTDNLCVLRARDWQSAAAQMSVDGAGQKRLCESAGRQAGRLAAWPVGIDERLTERMAIEAREPPAAVAAAESHTQSTQHAAARAHCLAALPRILFHAAAFFLIISFAPC